MPLQYDFFEVNELNNTKGKYRARAVYKGKITTEYLTHWMSQTHGVSKAVAKGFIMMFTDSLLDFICSGYEVEAGDLGYFSASVTSKLVDDSREIRAESVDFSRLNFRASIKTKKRIKSAGIEKAPTFTNKNKLPQSTREQRSEKLREYLSAKKPFVTRADYMRITALKRKNAAVDDLNAFTTEGWLVRHGAGRTVIYMLKG